MGVHGGSPDGPMNPLAGKREASCLNANLTLLGRRVNRLLVHGVIHGFSPDFTAHQWFLSAITRCIVHPPRPCYLAGSYGVWVSWGPAWFMTRICANVAR
jgi:hypothetical protein